MVFALAAYGSGKTNNQKQTASSACLNRAGDTAVEVTVDLSGGWSVEFVRGAAYLYDGEATEGKEGVAMLLTIDKDVYEEDFTKAMADGSHKEADGGVIIPTTGTGRLISPR